VKRELNATRDDVLQLGPVVRRELNDIRPAERAQRRAVHVFEGVRPLRDQDHRDVAFRRGTLLRDAGEGVDQVRAAFLEEGIHLVQDYDEVELVFLEMTTEALEFFGDREAAFREVGIKVLEQPQQDRVVAHALATIHDVPVDGPARFGRELPEVHAEPLRGMRLARPDGTVQERVAGNGRGNDGSQQAEETFDLFLPVDQLLGEVVEGQLPLVFEHRGPGPERHE